MLNKTFLVIFVCRIVFAIEPAADCVENPDGTEYNYGCTLQNFKFISNLSEFDLKIYHIDGFQNDNVERIMGLNLDIHYFPIGIFNHFKNIIELDIYKCQIVEMTEPFFNCENLNILDLQSNKLRTIKKGIFGSCTKLIKIYFQFNEITTVDEDAFRGLINIQAIILQSNSLTYLPEYLFRDNQKLVTVNIARNSLQTFPQKLLSNLSVLRTLNTDQNQISELSTYPSAFIDCKSLISIHFFINHLTKLKNGIFNGLDSVENLYFWTNRIDFIEEKVFSSMDKLKQLQLFNNKLVSLNSASFLFLPNLEGLEVFDNPIKAISYDFFDNFPKLKTLKSGNTNCINKNFTEITAEVIKEFNQCFAKIVYCNNTEKLCELNEFEVESNKRHFIEPLSKEFTVDYFILNENFSMSYIPLDIFNSFPDLNWFYINKVGLKNFTNLIDCMNCDKITSFKLSNNKFPFELQVDFSKFSSLRTISLPGNQLISFKSNNLKSKTLNVLDLNDNYINSFIIKDDTMKSLEVLNLQNNGIKSLQNFSFGNDSSIQQLNLEKNLLTNLQENSFNGLKSLQILLLSENNIDFIGQKTFTKLKELSILNLNQNNLQSISNNFSLFINSNKLENLHLKYNKLKNLQNGIFRGLKSLQQLYLNGNLLNLIANDVFTDTKELKVIDFGNNQLTSLNSALFSPLSSLKSFIISNNPIKAISYDFFEIIPKNLELKMENTNCINGNFTETTPEIIEQFNQCFAEIIYCNNDKNICVLDELKIDNDKKVFIEHLSKENAVTYLTVSENFTMSSIYLGIFDSFTELQIVNFSNVGLENMENLRNCLDCDNIEIFILDDNNLSMDAAIDLTKFPKLAEISMQRNGFKSFGSFNFKSDSVKFLYLSHNKINSVIINNEEMKNLTILDLTNNEISTLERLSFGNRSNIQELYLDYNSIQVLHKDSFYGLKKLEILSITHNDLKVIERETFSLLQKLRILKLDFNDLQSLSTDQFGGKLSQNLELLSVNHNNLLGISQKFIESLSDETNFSATNNPCLDFEDYLDCIEESEIKCNFVYENQIYICRIKTARVIENDLTYKITGLHKGSSTNINVKGLIAEKYRVFCKYNPKEINFEFPFLEFIDFDGIGLEYLEDFSNCSELQSLSFERNRITTLSNTVFEACPFIELINLENNFIYSINDKIISKLNNLVFFNFGDNNMTKISATFFSKNKKLETLKFHNNFITELAKAVFIELRNLKVLVVRGNPIEILHFDLLINLQKLEEIEMQNLNLLQPVPSNFFSYSRKLNKLLMNVNKIEKIERNLLKEQKLLEILEISSCSITDIENDSFENLNKLKYFDLHANKIDEINENLFRNLTDLEELDLSYCEIKDISSKSFEMLTKLQILRIDGNEIKQLNKKLFENLSFLSELIINSNEISLIDNEIFTQNTELIFLDMSSNLITNLSAKNFRNQQKMRRLIIEANLIELTDQETFKNLTVLEELSLHDNKINKLYPQMFENSINLKILDLSMNRLTFINANAFNTNTSFGNLIKLNFADNMITNIETQAFQSLINLKELNLRRNMIKTLTTNMFINPMTEYKREMIKIDISHNLVNQISSDFFDFISVEIFDAINNTCLKNNYRNLNSLNNLGENCKAKILECRNLNITNNNCEINGFKVNDNEEKFAFDVKVDGISAHDVNTVRIISSNISFIPLILYDTFQNLQIIHAQNVFLKRLQTIKNCTNLKILNLDLNKNLELGASKLINCVNLKTLSINKINLNELNILALDGLMNLEELFMEDSNAVNLNLYSNSLKILHMTRNNLKIDELTFRNLLNLEKLFIDVSNNSFDKMSLFNLKQLKILNISKRKITNSNFSSFDRENNLEILISNENEVERLNEEILKNLTNLIELEMMDNLINEIEVTAFRNCMNLKKINLESKQNGRIANLHSGTFSDLINLEILQLAGHQISTISSTIFENLKNLKFLRLKSNKITKIDDQAFATLRNLENLDLSENNYLNHLSSNVFINLHKIQILNLKKCQLKKIPSSIIKLKTLKYLDISHNQLSWLLFYPSFENLQFLDFSSNNITAINPKFFYENPNVEVPASSYSLNQCKSRNKCFDEFNILHLCRIENHKIFEFSCKIDKLESNQQTYNRSQVKYLHNKNKPLNYQVFELFELYENVLKVDLWNSAITDINGIKTCSELKHFDLRMNKIENLNENTLNECTKLEILILVKNKISFIDEKFFWNLKSLKFLDLSQNLIANLKDEMFKENMNLEKLFLNYNQISTLNSSFFVNLIKLKVLKLNNNSIKELTGNEIFKNLKSLNELHINHNQISKMNEEIFNSLIKLKYLNIEHNELTEINLSKMSLKFLDYFDVSSNQIRIFRGNFNNLSRLKTFFAKKNICIDKNFGNNENLNDTVLLHCKDNTKIEL